MKQIIFFLIFILLSAYVVSQGTEAYVAKHNRSDQSCHRSTTYGWYWNGQYCERCKSDMCLCTKYNTCDSCAPGYSLMSTGSGSDCQKCPSFQDPLLNEYNYLKTWTGKKFAIKTDDVNYKQATRHPSKYGDENLEKRFDYYDVLACCSPFPDTKGVWGEKFRFGLRATQCKANIPGQVSYQLLGSICWSILGCSEYTTGFDTPYRCSKCYDGFYLNENQECSQCDNKTFPTEGADGEKNYCVKCSAPKQCSECSPGYYIGRNNYRKAIDSTDTYEPYKVREYASYCIQCPRKNCICDLIASTEDSNTRKFTYTGPVNQFFYYDSKSSGNCLLCSTYVGATGCLRCKYEYDPTQAEKFQCLECKLYESAESETYYAPITTDYKCQPCPQGCFSCTWDTTQSKTTCAKDSCFNGFRWVQNSETKLADCMACKDQNTRCTTNQNNVEQITQCNVSEQATAARYLQGVSNGYMNRQPPSLNDQYLIMKDSTQLITVCIKNIYSCQEMEYGSTAGSCSTCYPDYYKVENIENTKLNICAKCESSQYKGSGIGNYDKCVKCQVYAQKTLVGPQLECIECLNGQNTINYIDKVDNFVLYKSKKAETSQSMCVKCPEGCKKCSLTDKYTDGQQDMKYIDCIISECQLGFAFNTLTKRCQKCSLQNCMLCDTDKFSVCRRPAKAADQVCFPNYRLWYSKDVQTQDYRFEQICESCEFGCAKCQDKRNVCTECLPEFYLWADVCQNKKKNCILHSGTTFQDAACQICAYGYRKVDGRCMACFSPRGAQIHCHEGCSTNFRTNVDLDAERKKVNVKTRLLKNLDSNELEDF